jgi:pimeloyl-ACP methyl ester carboxylesterase
MIGFESVPQEQVDRLLNFRLSHPLKSVDVDGVRWDYIACGQGETTLLLLPGGMRIAETAFPYVELFEDRYRVIVPSYPAVDAIDAILDGLLAILDVEGVSSAHVLGQSFGGMVCQVLAYCYPERVKNLVISGAGPLNRIPLRGVIISVLLAIARVLPERTLVGLFHKSIESILALPEGTQVFWKAYLGEIFERGGPFTKAHVLAHFRNGRDTLEKYSYEHMGTNRWQGGTLIVAGEKDSLISQADWDGLTGFYPQTQAVHIKGAGHTLAMAAPGAYRDVVVNFLEH